MCYTLTFYSINTTLYTNVVRPTHVSLHGSRKALSPYRPISTFVWEGKPSHDSVVPFAWTSKTSNEGLLSPITILHAAETDPYHTGTLTSTLTTLTFLIYTNTPAGAASLSTTVEDIPT